MRVLVLAEAFFLKDILERIIILLITGILKWRLNLLTKRSLAILKLLARVLGVLRTNSHVILDQIDWKENLTKLTLFLSFGTLRVVFLDLVDFE